MYIEPTIPFVEQEQTDVCASIFIRDLILMKNGNNLSAH